MATNVRSVNSGGGDRLALGGGGSALNGTGWTMLALVRFTSLAATTPILGFTTSTTNTIVVLYYDSGLLNYGSDTGDTGFTGVTLNTTDVFLIGLTQTSANAIRGHTANITTGAAAVHADGTSQTIVTTSWSRTELCKDAATFTGAAVVHGMAAGFNSVMSDATFNTLVTAKTTAAVHALSPLRLWDFTQASTATAVVNLETGSADEIGRTGTTVNSEAAFDVWTFGIGGGAATEIPILVMAPPIPT